MTSTVIVLFFLGLLVFGPKKTLEFAQEIGRLIAHAKRSVGQLTTADEGWGIHHSADQNKRPQSDEESA